MTFHEPQIEDGLWARPLLEEGGYYGCEFSFTTIYMWAELYRTKIARFEDFVIVRSESERLHYLYPAGHGDMEKAIKAILQDAEKDGRNPVFYSLDAKAVEHLEAIMPGRFHYEKPRGDSDYLYLSSNLADLPGKKYQKKRNHCSRFERSYPDWAFHVITPDDIDDMLAFNRKWCRLHDNRGDKGIEEEYQAIKRACSHYDELDLKGGYITVNNEVVAFSFGSAFGKDVFVTHVEKALYDVSGAYNIINREMARAFAREYTYINRENDVDEEGLREAKLSYHPDILTEEYTAELKVL